MKRFVALLLALCLLFGLLACSDKGAASSSAESVVCYRLSPPEGFLVSEENTSVFLSPNYPTDSSNINVIKTPNSVDFSSYTAESYAALLEAYLLKELGQEVDVTVSTFERIDDFYGFPAIVTVYELGAQGSSMTQLQLLVQADADYAFTFTDATPNSLWMEAFRKCEIHLYRKSELEAAPLKGVFDVPEGWTPSSEGQTYTGPDGYSTISLSSAEKDDEAFSGLTSEKFIEQRSQALAASSGAEVSMSVSEFTHTLVDGFPAIRIAASYNVTGMSFTSLEVYINADKLYSFSALQMGKTDYTAAFEQALSSLSFQS